MDWRWHRRDERGGLNPSMLGDVSPGRRPAPACDHRFDPAMATVVQSRAMRPIMMRGCEVDHAPPLGKFDPPFANWARPLKGVDTPLHRAKIMMQIYRPNGHF